MNCQADKAHNLAQVAALIASAVHAEQPNLIVLPEMFTYLGACPEAREQAAEHLPKNTVPTGDAYQMLAALARKHNIMIHGGSLCEKTDNGFYNTSVLFDAQGHEISRYRKMHLITLNTQDQQTVREADFYSPGETPSTCIITHKQQPYRLGMSICFDVRFSWLYQILAQAGCDLIVVPAAFFHETGQDHWETLLRARAIETQSYIIASAQTGSASMGEHQHDYWGHAMIIDPWGTVLADAGTAVGYICAEISLKHLRAVRKKIPMAHYPCMQPPDAQKNS
jgi:deaminated glutathione amidase